MTAELIIKGRRIGADHPPIVIAEIGHNHKGNIETCKQMFKAAKDSGADAVKLQKRDNKSLFTKKLYNEHIIVKMHMHQHMVNIEKNLNLIKIIGQAKENLKYLCLGKILGKNTPLILN